MKRKNSKIPGLFLGALVIFIFTKIARGVCDALRERNASGKGGNPE